MQSAYIYIRKPIFNNDFVKISNLQIILYDLCELRLNIQNGKRKEHKLYKNNNQYETKNPGSENYLWYENDWWKREWEWPGKLFMGKEPRRNM